MGLSTFEEDPTPPPYCSPSIDRSLTTSLIELSNNPLKSFSSSRFAHTPEWADGLDVWSSSQTSTTKTENSRRHLDFHCDLGIYLPRHEKPSSAPTSLKGLQIHSKIVTTNFTPERIRQLLRREKDLLLQTDSTNQQLLTDKPPLPVPTNTFRQSTSIEVSSTNEVRLPLRHTPSKSPSPPPPPPPSNPSLNQDTLKNLLKEHLTSLLTRGASTINANRTLLNVPSVEIKQQIRTDSKSIEERFAKLDQLIPTPPSSSSSQQIKQNQTSSLIFHPRSTLGLTVTPVDLNSQRNFQSISLEKMAQQRNFTQDNDSSSSVVSSRPSTQPVPLPSSLHQYQQQQRFVIKRNFEPTNSTSSDVVISNDASNKYSEHSQPIQHIRKGPCQPRSSSKTGIHRVTAPTTTTSIELLPPIISGKRLHIPLANHRYL